MNKLKSIAVIISLMCGSTFANETQLQPYIGLGIGGLSIETRPVGSTAHVNTDHLPLSAIVGAQINPYAALEARIGVDLAKDDRARINATRVGSQLNDFLGLYAKAEWPIHPNFSPYVIAGYTVGEINYKAAKINITDSDSDFSYGLGAKVNFLENYFVSLEYMNYFAKDEFNANGFTFAVGGKF